jgi:hypothetical protein
MDMDVTNSLLIKYLYVNRKSRKTLVYGIGLEAGFYSELNNMILAILYCLNNNIKFVLHSGVANFKIKNGWSDFFEPFCDEKNNWYTNRFDHRFPSDIVFYKRIILKLINQLYRIDYFTYELFNEIHSRENESLSYLIPELKIDGGIQQACEKIIAMIYHFNKNTRHDIDIKKQNVSFQGKYIGFHIRGGDKIIEHDLITVDKYIKKAESLSCIRQGFIYTDDYNIFKLVCGKYSEWNFQTLTEKNENGYFHSDFQNLSNEIKKYQLIKMFASMEILCKAEYTICTYSSNIGMFLGMMMGERGVGVDFDAWRIW